MLTEPRAIRYPIETPPGSGEAIEIAEGILWLRFPLPMALDHVNVFALDEGDGWTLIDTGFDTKRSRAIWVEALNGPLGGKPVRRVVVTHHHPDHVGLAGWFQEAHDAEILVTRTAWLTARMLTLDEQAVPPGETVAFYQGAGMDPEILAKRREERPFNFADVVAPLKLGFSRLEEGATVELGGRSWVVRFGQGHAPDHAIFWSEDGGLVLAGDQLLPSISPNIGVYPTEPDADPVAEWMAACKRLVPFATTDQLVLPGHKLPYTGLPTRLDQLIDNHLGALDRLRSHLKAPHTAAECFLPIFKRQVGGGEYGLALVEAVAHCSHLWQAGEATRVRREDGAWLYQMKGTGHG